MSLSVQQLLIDAQRLTNRLRDHGQAADGVISNAQDVLKEVEAMRQYQEDIENLNTMAHNRPRAQLVIGIQQENRHIRQLQHENKEFRAALEECQNALELIMAKYRQHMTYLVHTTKADKSVFDPDKSRLLQDRADKICEMADVMSKSIQIDDDNMVRQQEVMARLVTENKGLREMLEISYRNGSYDQPLIGPRLVSTGVQTEAPLPPATPIDPARGGSKQNETNSSSFNNSSKPICSPSAASGTSSTSGGNRGISPSSSSICSQGSVIEVNGVGRPLSSASENSEESISEDDEVTFNTIKRKSSVKCDHSSSSSSDSAVKITTNGGLDKETSPGIVGNGDNNNGHHIESESNGTVSDESLKVVNGGKISSRSPTASPTAHVETLR